MIYCLLCPPKGALRVSTVGVSYHPEGTPGFPSDTPVSDLVGHLRRVHRRKKYREAYFQREPPANLQLALSRARAGKRVRPIPSYYTTRADERVMMNWQLTRDERTIRRMWERVPFADVAEEPEPLDPAYEALVGQAADALLLASIQPWPRPYPAHDKGLLDGWCCEVRRDAEIANDRIRKENPSCRCDPLDEGCDHVDPRRLYRHPSCAHTRWMHDARTHQRWISRGRLHQAPQKEQTDAVEVPA